MDQTEGNSANEVKTSSTKAVTVRINPWWLSGVLAVGLLVAVVMWRPWSAQPSAGDRTVTVSGSATLQAEPDEFVFYPTYEFSGGDKAAGLADLTAKSEEVVAGLKKVGVADKDIKTNANGYRDYYYYNEVDKTHTYSLQVTVTAHTKADAQKAQDYLLTTDPVGGVTPQATFSAAKQKELESRGRDQATKEARTKADQQAKNLGFTVGKVKSVEDSGDSGYGGVMPMAASAMDISSTQKSLAVQPGQNDLTYTVQVTYYIK